MISNKNPSKMGIQSVGHDHVLGGLRYPVQRHRGFQRGFQPLLPSLVSTKSLWWARGARILDLSSEEFRSSKI